MNVRNEQHRVCHPLTAAGGRVSAHRGFTLAELLIVILIMSIVTVATIPFLKPALDSRRIREAARLFTSQLATAQSQAIANGSSVGVWMEKIHMGGASSGAVEGKASTDLSICEVPDPYAGDTNGSTVLVNVTSSAGSNTGTVTMNSADIAWVGLIHTGDLIRFNNTGSYYQLAGPNFDGTLIQTTLPAATVFSFSPVPVGGDDYFPNTNNPAFRYLPAAAWTPAGWTTSFQIIRQPVRSAGAPLQLPSGAVVDIGLSGMGSGNTFPILFDDSKPILLMFDRTGAVECIYHGTTRSDVTAPLYFLIGKREGLSLSAGDPPAPDYVINSADPDNIWVSVNPHTGVASTTEVASGSGSISQSRAFAISAQAMGGK